MGQQILFRADKDGVSGLFVMDAYGANIHPVRMSTAPGNDLDLGNATYSADGSRIFFQSAVQVSPDDRLLPAVGHGCGRQRIPTSSRTIG